MAQALSGCFACPGGFPPPVSGPLSFGSYLSFCGRFGSVTVCQSRFPGPFWQSVPSRRFGYGCILLKCNRLELPSGNFSFRYLPAPSGRPLLPLPRCTFQTGSRYSNSEEYTRVYVVIVADRHCCRHSFSFLPRISFRVYSVQYLLSKHTHTKFTNLVGICFLLRKFS